MCKTLSLEDDGCDPFSECVGVHQRQYDVDACGVHGLAVQGLLIQNILKDIVIGLLIDLIHVCSTRW